MCDIQIISDEEIEKLLKWDQVINAVKQSLISVTSDHLTDEERKGDHEKLKMVNPSRIIMGLPSNKGMMLCMPGYMEGFTLDRSVEASLTCKILNISNDPNKDASIKGYIYLFDENSGKMLAIMGGEHITEWRTAAVTCVATKVLWSKANNSQRDKKRVLAIMGAGVQGRIHAIALQLQFHFDEIRIWNRTLSRAERLVNELKAMGIIDTVKLCQTGQQCAQEADVIVTATPAREVILQDDWVKAGALVNAIGVSKQNEISSELYKRADVYVESKLMATAEIPQITVVGEIGELLLGLIKRTTDPNRIIVFQSRGMAIFDSIVAKLIYNAYMKNKASSSSNSESVKRIP